MPRHRSFNIHYSIANISVSDESPDIANDFPRRACPIWQSQAEHRELRRRLLDQNHNPEKLTMLGLF
jgi:hypothetical protein